MTLDEKYTSIDVCPETDITIENTMTNGGVCPHCGWSDNYIIIHHRQVVGRWNTPTLWERLWHKKSALFVRKEDEDAILAALTGEEK